MPPQDGARGDDQPHRGETVDRHRPGQQGKQRPVRPRQPGTSARPLTPGDSELVTQHEDLGVLPPRLPARQAQQRHGTGNDQEDQLQAHKPKIIPPPVGPRPARRIPNARPRSAGPMPRRHRFSASSGVAGASEPRLPGRGWAGGVRQSKRGSASLAMIQPNCSSSGISSLAGIILSSRDTMAPRVCPRCSAITARSATARTPATSSSSSSSVHRAPGEASGASPAPSAAGPVVMHG